MDLAVHDPGAGIVIVKGRPTAPPGLAKAHLAPCASPCRPRTAPRRGIDLHLDGTAEVGGGAARDGYLAEALRGEHRLGRGEKKWCRPGGEGHVVHGPQATA